MKKVLVDSSVWVSLFARDTNYPLALKIFRDIKNDGDIILLLPLIYIEVINALKRLNMEKSYIAEAKHFITSFSKIHICHTTTSFWFNEVVTMIDHVDLKASDLIILVHALKYGALLHSFDKKLLMAYKKIC